MSIQRVLITGISGYTGSRLAHYFAELGVEVHGIVRVSSMRNYLYGVNCTLHEYDGSYGALERVFGAYKFDAVFHLAAISTYQCAGDNIAGMIGANITFGTQLLEAMAQRGCRKLVNTSTYWQHYTGSGYQPNSFYAATKQAFENIVDFYCFEHDMSAISLKLFDIYGAGDTRSKVFGLINRAHAAGEALDMTEGEQKICVVDVDDVVRAYEIAVTQLKTGAHQRYFVGTEPRALRDVVEIYIALSGQDVQINWGALPYREKQIMVPYVGDLLPDWQPHNSLEDTIRKIV